MQVSPTICIANNCPLCPRKGLPSYHGINKTYHHPIVWSQVVGLGFNHLFTSLVVYPESLTFISVIVFAKVALIKIKM